MKVRDRYEKGNSGVGTFCTQVLQLDNKSSPNNDVPGGEPVFNVKKQCDFRIVVFSCTHQISNFTSTFQNRMKREEFSETEVGDVRPSKSQARLDYLSLASYIGIQ